jgi:hypothetical protein
VINPTLYDKVPYEFEKDFDPVTLAVATTLVLAVHPSVPARTVDELVALIKAHPGRYSYASPGTGTPGHLVGEQFRLSLGLDLVHVPFNSAGLAVGASVAGHTPICFASPSPAAQQVIEGRLRGLAVTSKSRSQALPKVPTMAEAGYPNIAGDNWQAVVVPAGTPRDIVAFLHREIIKIIALPTSRSGWLRWASNQWPARPRSSPGERGQNPRPGRASSGLPISKRSNAGRRGTGRGNVVIRGSRANRFRQIRDHASNAPRRMPRSRAPDRR